jgi:two-component system, OmpR family, phosphate regulon sensor histidine kinase PhoR
MKRNVLLAFILMIVSVTGITGLQFYYSYSNYKVEQNTFRKEIDEAFKEAVDSAFSAHQKYVVQQFKSWISDAGYMAITAKWDSVNKVTVFNLKEIKSNYSNNQVSLSIDSFKKRTDSLTPESRETIIQHLTNHVANDLKKGVVWYFTQGLGDRLNDLYYNVPISRNVLAAEYKKALASRYITAAFKIVEAKNYKGGEYNTITIDIGTKTGAGPQLKAYFINADVFLLGRLRWVIGGSVLLLVITLSCFWYTARLLLSQQKLNALKDDFINNMTHEIHTPLAGITVTAQALKQFNHSLEEQQDYLDIILYQADKLNNLTDEILAGARLGVDFEEKESVLIGVVLHDVMQGVGQVARVKVGAMPNIAVDIYKNHLGRAVANLLDNALKYSEGQVVFLCTVQKQTLHISIADNGPGIPAEFKTKVFETFYRIPTGNVHNIKGYGLGLSYVKKVAAIHGGSVVLSDNIPCGSVFTIVLPL